jgi:hypothetical protein
MHSPMGAEEANVLWSREGDAWVGVLGVGKHPNRDDGRPGRNDFEVELLLRATDWQVEVSYAARGAFKREHIQAGDVEEAKAWAADLLHAFRAKCEAPIDDELEIR